MIHRILGFVLIVQSVSSASQAEHSPSACEVQAFMVEQEHGIPHGLLSAMTLVESGRRQGTTHQAWPWAVQSHGRSYYFSSKAAAIGAVRRLIHQGVRNIDVGCAQVNLGHHPRAFRNLDEAFDPRANIHYAAFFLKKLLKKTGSWHQAVAHYHSANVHHHIAYRNKVYKAWEREKHKPHDAQRGGLLASHQPAWTISGSSVQSQETPQASRRVVSQYLSRVPPLAPQRLLWNAGLHHVRRPATVSSSLQPVKGSGAKIGFYRPMVASTHVRQPLPLSGVARVRHHP